MESVQPSEDGRASKKPRYDVPVESTQNGLILLSSPELDCIKQSDTQLAYLQAQLAATESLYAAYQTEFETLAKQLGFLKRAQLKDGLQLWKDAGADVDAATRRSRRQQRQQQLSWEDDLTTYSDIEEEVLLLETNGPLDEPQPRLQDQHRHGSSPVSDGDGVVPAAGNGDVGREGSAATTAAAVSDAATGPGTHSRAGGGDGAMAADDVPPSTTALASGRNATAAAGSAAPTAGAGAVAVRNRLEALEAICSAVAQEDMEAQGAVACLAGRTAKYYLRSTAVTLGRTTESKGDVGVDLTPEEPPATAPRPRLPRPGPPAAAAADGGDQGTVQAQLPGTGAACTSANAGAATCAQAASSGGRGHVVSRRQAMIRLGADGQFRLVNMGRQVVKVNDAAVPQNHTINLPHLSLVEVASVRLLFMANMAAVERVMRRSAALSL